MMKPLLIVTWMLCGTSLALAQTPKPVQKPAPSASRIELKSKAKQVAAAVEAAEDALTPDELAIAEQIHLGKIPCELGSHVQIDADAKLPGYFHVATRTAKYRMIPVATSTGAIRLEDKKAGAVWLQLANKSMLMNQKLGQRLADECMGTEQQAINEVLKKNPARSVLEPALPAGAK